MEKYLVVHLVYGEKLSSEAHDIEGENVDKAVEAIKALGNKLGAHVFFQETGADRVEGRSYAEIEYNFDLSAESKKELMRILPSCFNDMAIRGKGAECFNILSAIKFLRTDGELYLFNEE